MNLCTWRLGGRCLVLLAVLSVWTALTAHGQLAVVPDFATALKQAKATGLPILVLVAGKGDKLSPALLDPKVIGQARAFVIVTVPPDGAVIQKLGVGMAGGLVFLDSEGSPWAEVAPGADADSLVSHMQEIKDKARAAVLEKFESAKAPAAQKIAFDSYVKLGANAPDLLPLLQHGNAGVALGAKNVLLARAAQGADWALLNGMASPEADLRVACYPLAVTLAKAPGVPPVKFWKEAPEEERNAVLAKWRKALYGEVPPINKVVLDFALANFGRQVSNGECAQLATLALEEAKGQPLKKENQAYNWGRALKAGEPAYPGDIIQLDDVVTKTGTSFSKYPHHTQVIRRVLSPGYFEVLEQNVGGRRTVGLGKFNLGGVIQGTPVIFRPLPIEEEKK